mmetsp:Transcript_50819/g.91327  ORF Transcript_50819/g.91327 Transcript_50819/m.91327 type:complete len:254 (-) Transcript_50819:24-785(-)
MSIKVMLERQISVRQLALFLPYCWHTVGAQNGGHDYSLAIGPVLAVLLAHFAAQNGVLSKLFHQFHSSLSAVGNFDLLAGFTASVAHCLYLLDDIIAVCDLAKNDVLAVKVRSLASAYKELAAVCVGSGVGHGEATFAGVFARLAFEALILKLVAVDGLATSAVVIGEVTTLTHEAWDHPVEAGALVTIALLSRAERTEVLSSLGHVVSVQLEGHPAYWCPTNSHVKEDLWIRHPVGSLRCLVQGLQTNRELS